MLSLYIIFVLSPSYLFVFHLLLNSLVDFMILIVNDINCQNHDFKKVAFLTLQKNSVLQIAPHFDSIIDLKNGAHGNITFYS